MALRLSTDLKNYIVNQAIIKQLAGTMGTGGTATLKIYTGSQPASADDPPAGTNGTLLCTIINVGWGGSNGTRGATSGTSTFGTDAGYTGTAAATGTAGWGRFECFGTGFTGSAATHRLDGDVGTGATCAFIINAVQVTSGGAVSILAMPVTVG